MKISGIYRIINLENDKSYVGSAVNIANRWRRHKNDLKKNKHHSILLQRSFNKYGIDKFKIEILEECCLEKLIEKEQYYIDYYNPEYNICKIAGSTLGRKESEELRLRRREYALKNNIKPPESTYAPRRKPVNMLDDNFNIINKFISISEACRFIGRDCTFSSCLTRAIKLKVKAYNYYWEFE